MQRLPFFVYGTLKRGELNVSVWPARPIRVIPATTAGELYDLGPYPCLLAGDDTVCGELWEVADADYQNTLATLDQLEGYGQGGKDLYLRVIVECQTASATVQAFTYIYNQPLTAKHRRIQPNENGIVSWPHSR